MLHKQVASTVDVPDIVTVNVALVAFSLDVVTSAIVMLGGLSSSAIVNVAVESLIVALDAFDKVIVASFPS